ncbi:MAG TPA: hypothetical protein VKS60_01760 [Stellaceae bacterium]|nr:hypothetical protein [Stellaceae bacterium]
MEMDDTPVSAPLNLSPALLARVKAAADEEERPVEEMLGDALDQYLMQRRLRRRGRVARLVEALADAELEAIAAAEMDPRHGHLDRELE